MAFVYEVNGQKVEFDKEPTEADIDEAARALRPAPKSQQQRPVEGAGGAAFGVYRPQGRRPESQQDREAAKEMAPQSLRGLVTGSLGAPSDILNLPGTVYSAVSGQPAPYKVPLGSEEWNQMLPFRVDTPHANLGRFGGEVMAPFPGAVVAKTIPKAVGAVGDVVSGAVGTGTGYIARPGRTPRGYQQPSQRNPIGATFTPPEEFAKFERGELPYGQMPEQRPISELPEGRLDRAAMMLSGGNIPNAGQGPKAFGERLGETYRNPLTAAADIGSMFFTGGVPVLSTLRGGLAGVQALADMRLANKGFTPELPKILNEYQTGVRPLPGVQPGPMPRDFMASGAVNPAAQAAMATTQAKVAQNQPRAPRAPVQPRAEWQLPDVGTHYTMAEQGSTNFGDTFNRAVAARQADLLKDARQRGQKLTPQQAEDLAYDEIKEWRGQNVEAFKPKQEPAGPTIAQPGETPALVKTPGEGTLDKPNVEFDRSDWFKLQTKVKLGKPLSAGEQSLADKITNRYGPDPFGSGDLSGNKMFNTVAQGETQPVPVDTTPVAAVEPTPTAEMPVVETKKRDMSLNNASKDFTSTLEDIYNKNLSPEESIKAIDDAVKKYEIVTYKKQMRVYDEAYDAAIAELKPPEEARKAGNLALKRHGLPLLSGERSVARLKPKDTNKQETAMGQAWFDDTIKNADKPTKQMYQDMLERYNGDVAQLYRDISAQQAGKTTGKSLFEEPLEQADTGKYNTMPETTPTKPLTKKQIKEQERLDNEAARMREVQTPYIKDITGESESTFNNLVDHMRNRPYMAGVERSKSRVKGTGEVFTPTPLVDEMLKHIPENSWTDKTQTFLDPAAGDGQILSEIVLRKIQNGATHKQALENTYGVDIMADNVKVLRDRLIGGNESLRPIAEQNLLVGNALDPFEKVPGQTALDHKRMVEVFGENEIESLRDKAKTLPSKKAAELNAKADELEKYSKSLGIKPEKSTPPKDVLEMKTGGKEFASKADFEEQALMDKLAGKITTGSFVDNGMRYEISAIDYGNAPRQLLESLNKPLTQVRVFSEKTGNQISGPAVEIPEKSLRQRVEEKMRKRK